MATYDPAQEYGRRLKSHRDRVLRTARADSRLANARLLVFLAALAVVAAAVFWDSISMAWVIIPVAVFAGLVIQHARVLQAKARSEAAVRLYEHGIDRIEGRWIGRGRQGQDFAPSEHLYANDLDIFGEGSLFELLCTAATRSGEATLAAWLCEPASPETVTERQQAVDELRANLDLREDLALYGAGVRHAVRPHALAKWVEAPVAIPRRPWRTIGFVLAALSVLSVLLWAATGVAAAFFLMLVVMLVFNSFVKRGVAAVDAAAQEPDRELTVLAQVLARLEREPFQSPLLARLRQTLIAGSVPASRRIARLDRLVDLLEARHNILFGPVAFMLGWGLQVALAIEAWRVNWGKAVAEWLGAVGELEALCSLAAYAYEHPEDPLPEFTADGPVFEATGIGHPLIAESACVRNDVRLGPDLRLLVVSGSNMSGKSTLLRTVGINAVLAQTGAPVRAKRLRLSPLSIGATLRVQDSIRKGTSRFYAEILRLKDMIETAHGSRPLLFLLDEILHGTNSHDRRIGADAIVRELIEANAAGLITTHDLAVTQIVDMLDSKAANIHFTDHLEDGRLVFDYLLRPGVVSEGNALRLMRSMGLPV